MKPIIEIQGIGKKYKLRGQEMPYLTIREALLGKNMNRVKNEFWALKNISFDVFQGESIGIIGKNGAGKSTLLKILSKITPPTEGRIIARGRVASLLEVGTGFHPELTGMENIYLNGSILGLKKIEIKKKIDQIIDFSGVEKFIDTPLKHYSSGMQLRLAFAVAAHLEPEILIVDEVLAVGDAEFQKKSLGKMEEVAKQGRTVLFVSHNLAAVKTLCGRGVLLNNGLTQVVGEIGDVVDRYKYNINQIVKTINTNYGVFDLKNHKNKIYNKNYGMQKVTTYCDDQVSEKMYAGCKFKFVVNIKDNVLNNKVFFGFVIKDSEGENYIGVNNRHKGIELISEGKEKTITVEIGSLPIYRNDIFFVDLFLGENSYDYDIIADAFQFEIEAVDIYESSNYLDLRFNKVVVKDINFSINER